MTGATFAAYAGAGLGHVVGGSFGQTAGMLASPPQPVAIHVVENVRTAKKTMVRTWRGAVMKGSNFPFPTRA